MRLTLVASAKRLHEDESHCRKRILDLDCDFIARAQKVVGLRQAHLWLRSNKTSRPRNKTRPTNSFPRRGDAPNSTQKPVTVDAGHPQSHAR